MNGYRENLKSYFEDSAKLEKEIMKQLDVFAAINPVSFRDDPLPAVWIFHFNKNQWNTIDKYGDIRPELFITIFTGQFCSNMQTVV